MGTVFHIPLLSHEEEKKLAVESDKDSEGSYENIILPQWMIRNEDFCS